MTMPAEELWTRACAELSAHVSQEVFSRWIKVIRPCSLDGDRLRLSVANDFYVFWLEENYLPMIAAAATVAAGREIRVNLAVEDRTSAAPVAAPSKSAPAAKARAPAAPRDSVSTPLDAGFTFESFVLGPSNTFAHAACMAVAQTPGRAYNPLLIFGGSGLGKTHLMQAIGHHVLKTARAAVVCYTSAEAFLNEYIECLQHNRMVAFRKKYRGVDLLLIDDIHFLAGKAGLQEEFFHMFNELHTRGRQIVLTSDRPPSEIQGLDKRLVSRFEWGVTTQIEPPDVETRVAILRKKAEALKLRLSDEIILFIAENIRNNIRKMEGALKSVAAYSALQGAPLTREAAMQVLRGCLDRTAADAPTIDVIQKTVAEFFDVRISDMTSKRRMQTVVVPRQVAMYLSRALTSRSLPSIGDAFSKNHATVIHACRLIGERMRHDPSFQEMVATLRRRLGAD
jgi:chromosomal replication initiator protein